MADFVANAVRTRVEHAFGALGRAAGSDRFCGSPLALLVIPVVTCLILASGVSQMAWENSAAYLWTPVNLPQRHRLDYLADEFPVSRSFGVIFMVGENMLSKEALLDMESLHRSVTSTIESPEGKHFQDVCVKLFEPVDANEEAPCDVQNVLILWDYNRTVLLADPNPLATIAAAEMAGKIHLGAGFGSVVRNMTGAGPYYPPVSARAAVFNYDTEEKADGHLEWELEAIDTLLAAEYDSFQAELFFARSFDDEILRSVEIDIPLFGFALIILVGYLSFTLGPAFDSIKSRYMLGLTSLTTVVLALGAGYGLLSYSGFKMNSVNFLAAFILAGVSADNLIVITDFFDREDESLSLEARVSNALRHAGTAISLTSLSTVVAFATGLASPLPGVAAFSATAAYSFFFNYALQCTMFPVLLAMDTRRAEAGFHSCFCCVRASTVRRVLPFCASPTTTDESAAAGAGARGGDPEGGEEGGPDKEEEEDVEAGRSDSRVQLRVGSTASTASGPDQDKPLGLRTTSTEVRKVEAKSLGIPRWLMRHWGWFVTLPVAAFVTIALYASAAGVSLSEYENLEVGLAPRDVMPDKSYVRDALDVRDEYFDSPATRTQVVLEDVDVSDATTRANLAQMRTDLLAYPRVIPPVITWYNDFFSTLNGTYPATPTAARAALQTWLTTPAQCPLCQCDCRTYQAKVVLASEAAVAAGAAPVVRSNFAIFLNLPQTSSLDMINLDDDMQDILADNDLDGFVFTDEFLYRRSDYAMPELMLQSMAIAAASVIALLLLVLNPFLAATVGIAVFTLDSILFGYMRLVDININAVSLVIIILGTGLAVDTTAHITHYYSHAQGIDFNLGSLVSATPWWSAWGFTLSPVQQRARVRESVEIMGSSVLKGALTTIMGTAVLGAANSQTFRVFFYLVAGIIITGILAGLAFLPAFLSFVGICDLPKHDETEPKQAGNKAPPHGAAAASAPKAGPIEAA